MWYVAPMSHVDAPAGTSSYRARLGDRGRLVLPADLRRAAGLHEGDEFLISIESDGLRLVSRRELARAGRGAFAHFVPGRSIVDELIADRRAEAAREEALSAVPRDHQLR